MVLRFFAITIPKSAGITAQHQNAQASESGFRFANSNMIAKGKSDSLARRGTNVQLRNARAQSSFFFRNIIATIAIWTIPSTKKKTPTPNQLENSLRPKSGFCKLQIQKPPIASDTTIEIAIFPRSSERHICWSAVEDRSKRPV